MGYTIKEVAEKMGLSPHAIRYYEKQGLIPPVARDAAGNRVFDEKDLSWLDTVLCLKKTHMPIAAIRQIVALSASGDETMTRRKQLLLEHRQEIMRQMEQLEESLQKVDRKIAYYDGAASC